MKSPFVFFITLIFIILASCSSVKQSSEIDLESFSLDKNILKFDFDKKNLDLISLNSSGELNFSQSSTQVKINNVLKENETLPEDVFTHVISKKIYIKAADRFLLKITHPQNKQFVLPFITNEQHVQMPVKLIYEKNLDKKQREKNFLVKVPAKGFYFLHFLSFSPRNNLIESGFYFGDEQNINYKNETSCGKNLAYNLRHCVKSDCKIDMTTAYEPLESPPIPVYYQYKISPKKNYCQITIESNLEDTKNCKIPVEFNPLIQDCGQPLKDPYFVKKLNSLNQKLFSSDTPEQIMDNSKEMQQLWLNDYPISLMCSKELDFQLPDLDQLMDQYCKTFKTQANFKLQQWKVELEAKIAVKHATLNFKALTTNRETNSDTNNQYILNTDVFKNLNDSCFSKNIVQACIDLSDKYSSINEQENAGLSSAHACDLGHALSCQKAGLSLTQAKKRELARKYEIKGCQLKDSISCYNVACGFCIKNNPSQALKFFKKHLALGSEDPLHIIFDPTIQCINDTPTYKNFLKKALAP